MRKTCRRHGEYESSIADNEDDFVAWTAHPVINVPPKKAITKAQLSMNLAMVNLTASVLSIAAHVKTICRLLAAF